MASVLFKWLLWFHPFFVSVAQVDHNAKEKSLEISIRIFTDDLEKTLRKNYATKIDLTAAPMHKSMETLVDGYVSNHYKIALEGKPATMKFVGFEQIEESTWCYFEVDNIAILKKISITNTILFDYQKQQTNMNIVKYNNVEKTRKLDNPEKDVVFEF